MRYTQLVHEGSDRLYGLLLALGVMVAGGCKTPPDDHPPPVQRTQKAEAGIMALEPTGTVRRNASIGDAADAVRDAVNEVDIDGANQAIADIRALAAEIRSRVASLPDNLGDVLDDKLDEARLTDLSDHLQQLIDTTSAKVARFDPDAFNRAVADLRELVVHLSDKVEAIDIQAGNTLANDLSSLKPGIDHSIKQAAALMEDVQRVVDSLPIDQVTQSVTRLEEAATDLRRVFRYVQATLCVIIAVLLVVGYCAIAKLRRSAGT